MKYPLTPTIQSTSSTVVTAATSFAVDLNWNENKNSIHINSFGNFRLSII